ncbi:ankyrin repeat protein, partial [Colletotrichum incanum]
LIPNLCDACVQGQLEEVNRLIRKWKAMGPDAMPPPGPEQYPIGSLEPILYFAIRQHQAPIVSYLLDEGMKFSRLAQIEASQSRCGPPIWQVFLDHGWDISHTNSAADPPPLAFVLDDKEFVEWYLAHGADPNAEAKYGWIPWLRAITFAPLEIIKMLHAADGRLDLAVPFVGLGPESKRRNSSESMEVLQYLLDNGADINARLFAHNHYNYR